MPARHWRWFVLALLVPLCGCPYESTVPLVANPTEHIDPALVGDWLWVDVDEDDPEESDIGVVRIFAWDETRYLLSIAFEEFSPQGWEAPAAPPIVHPLPRHLDSYSVLPTNPVHVEGTAFLQVRFPNTRTTPLASGEDVMYYILGYELVGKDELVLRYLSDDFYAGTKEKNDPTTSEALYKRVAENLTNPRLFENDPMHLYRLRKKPESAEKETETADEETDAAAKEG